MAATVATPLERVLGRIAGITEMTSTSTQGVERASACSSISAVTWIAQRARRSGGHQRGQRHSRLHPCLHLPSIARPTPRRGPYWRLPHLAHPHQDQLYDVAFTDLGQRLAQIPGVGSSESQRQLDPLGARGGRSTGAQPARYFAGAGPPFPWRRPPSSYPRASWKPQSAVI